MGFIKGFLLGAALTSSTFYLTLQVHLATRQHQHLLLREQIDLINGLSLPARARLDPHQREAHSAQADAAVLARRGYAPYYARMAGRRPDMMELLKERWNEDVKTFARRLMETDWEDVRQKGVTTWNTAKRLVRSE